MRPRVSLSFIPLLLLAGSGMAARNSVDPAQARLEMTAHLAAMTQNDVKELSSRAASGDREAQFLLGTIYRQGRIVEKNAQLAEDWLLRSAEAGYAPAQSSVGLWYWYGSKDPTRAVIWLQRAAQQGDPEAQFLLGSSYEQGSLGTTDYEQARIWLAKSARQGHPDAQVSLGQMYENGESVKPNYAVEAKWYRKAAEHVPNLGGAGQGRNELGLLYFEGQGVRKDYVRAYFWFALAGAEENLKDAQARMIPAQIRKAQRMADDWKRHHPLPENVSRWLQASIDFYRDSKQ